MIVLRYVQEAAVHADQSLFKNMQSVAKAVKDYKLNNGQFPNSSNQLDLPPLADFHNPYFEEPILRSLITNEPSDVPSQEPISIKFNIDPELSTEKIDFFKNNLSVLPTQPAGTINVLYSSQDLFFVWANGVDGQPIKEQSSGHMLAIVENASQTENKSN